VQKKVLAQNANNDEPQPSSDAEKNDDEGVNKESGIDDQERPGNNTQDVNTARPSVNTASTNVNTGSLNINNFLLLDHVIGDIHSGVLIRRMIKNSNEQGFISTVYEGKTYEDLHTYLFACFLSQVEPKKVYKNKKDDRGIMIRNKARLVAQGYTQGEGIDYDEVFAPVARIESIRLFLAYASFKDFVVYQMDVKSAFLYGKIEEEVYVCQPLGFEDPEFPDRVYKIDKTLFINRIKSDILLVQVYVDDIIFGSTKKELCTEFEKLMHKKFQMSSMGELTFFLGLQVSQKDDGIFISQDKYVDEILKKFGFSTVKTASTPMETSKPLLKDAEAEDVDVHLYRSMIGSLMYLTASRPDIMFVVCACARFQVTPKVSHLHAVKRIFRYLKGQPKLGLWYPKDSPFDLEAYTDSDYAGASLDRKSTTGGCQFLGSRLISWQCKKQTIVANSTTEAEYVAAASCCGQGTDSSSGPRCQDTILGDVEAQIRFKAASKQSNDPSLSRVNTLGSGEDNMKLKELMEFSLVDKKKVIITEKSVRSDLMLEDAEGTECLPNDVIFEQLTLIGAYPNEATNEEPISTLSCDPPQSGEDILQLTELMSLCTKLQKQVLNLEEANTAQAKEIDSLNKRVKQLEKYDEEMLFDVHDDLQGEEVIAEKEVAEKEVSAADPVTTAGEVVTTVNATTTVNELTLAQTLIEIKAAKPKAVTTTATTITTVVASTRPKVQGIVFHDQEEQASIYTPIVSSSQSSQLP
ncbi:putative ribonuclease H-like domain-containing protein, partial [Tanacetum coccineum]